MSSNLTYQQACFAASSFKYMSQIQFLQYQTAWVTFDKVQAYNSNISTLRAQNPTKYYYLTYYQFATQTEKATYTTGQFLHQQVYPNSNWNSVQTN